MAVMTSRMVRIAAGLAGGLALAFLLYVLAGYYLVPHLIHSQLWPMLSAKLGGQIQSGRVEFDPLDFTLNLHDLSLRSPDGNELATVGEFALDVDAADSLKNRALVANGRIIQPKVKLLLDQKGTANFGFLLPKTDEKQPAPESSSPFPFLLTRFSIENGSLDFQDQSRGAGFKKQLSPLDFSVENLGSIATGPARFTFKAIGESKDQFATDGDLHFEENGLDGEFKLQDLDVAPLAAWLAADLPFEVRGGTLSLALKMKYAGGDMVIPTAKAEIKQLSLTRQGQPFMDVGLISAEGLSFDANTQQIDLKGVRLEKIDVKSPAAVTIDAIKADELAYLAKTKKLGLKAVLAQKINSKSPTPATLDSLQLEGIDFQADTRHLDVKTVLLDKIDVNVKSSSPTSVAVATLKLEGLSGQLDTQQIELNSVAIDKIDIKSPTPLTVAALKLDGLSVKLDSQQLELKSVALDKIDIKLPVPAAVDAIKAQDLSVKQKLGQYGLKGLTLERVELKSPTPVLDLKGRPVPNNIPLLNVREVAVKLAEKSLQVGQISSQGAMFAAWLERDGSAGFPGLPKGAAKAENGKVQSAPPWKLELGRVELNACDIALRDFSQEPPVAMHLAPLNLLVQNFSTEKGQTFAVGMNTGLSMNGRVAVEGKLKLSPLTANFKLYVDDLSLPPLQPYLDKLVGIKLVKGALNLNADIGYAAEPGFKLRLGGDVAVANFASNDKAKGRDFINWKKLRLNDIIFEAAENRLSIREVIANEPFVRAFISPEKKLNLVENLTPPTTAKTGPTSTPVKPETPPKPVKPGPDLAVVVGVIHIYDGRGSFADQTIQPTHFRADMYDLNGDIRNLSSREDAKSDVMLNGKLNEGSTVKIYGKFNPFKYQMFTDMVLNFNDVNLTTLSPYSGKFAGYRIEKGKLSMDLHYKLDKGQLVAENKFVLDHLVLGERVESADATTLPVRLAVSLLKDSEGKIDIDLPISGDILNPQISLRSLLAGAATALLSKLATSPLSALGGLGNLVLGGKEEDVGTVKFAPGKIDLAADQKTKLSQIAKALKDRTGINLEIKGTAHKIMDRPYLAESELFRQLKNTKLIEIGMAKGKQAAWDETALSEADYGRLFTALYRSKYPAAKELQDLKLGSPLTGALLESAKRNALDNWAVGEGALRRFAQARGEAIRNYLVKDLGLSNQRIYLMDVKLCDPNDKEIKALLSLDGS